MERLKTKEVDIKRAVQKIQSCLLAAPYFDEKHKEALDFIDNLKASSSFCHKTHVVLRDS